MIKLLAEFFGTLILLMAILKYGKALPIGLSLTVAILFFGHISGGHFNPAVSFMKLMSKEMSQMDFIQYVAAQGLAAMAALKMQNM